MNQKTLAVEWYDQGWNCAQSVAAAAAVRRGEDPGPALRAAGGFGGGMGRMQSACGALTGGIIALGATIPQTGPTGEHKTVLNAAVQSLWRHFTTRWKCHTCREILGLESGLHTPKGQAEYRERNLSSRICRECVQTVDAWLREYHGDSP